MRKVFKEKLFMVLFLETVSLLLAFFISFAFNQLNFYIEFIISIIIITLLVFCCKWLIEKYVAFNDKRILFISTLITSAVGLIVYFAIVYGRNYTYESDHVVYYNLQNELKALFINSPLKGLVGIVFSCWQSDYSYFINLFLAALFQFTDGSNEAFVMTYYIILLVPVCFVNNILLLDLSQKNNIKRRRLFVFLGNLTFLCFPLVHSASLLGMPDLFGMFFVISIVIILTNFDFMKFNYNNAIILSLLFVCLAITRRWYIFWMVGFVPMFLVVTFLFSLYGRDIQKIKRTLFSEVKMIIFAAGFTLVLLGPFIYNTFFQRNYAEDYSKWYLGGFWYELWNQMGYLGILIIVMIFIGIVYGLISDNLRSLCIVAIIGYFVSVYSFTTIQNMGKHQSLLLLMYYLLFMYMFYCLICKLKSRIIIMVLVSFIVVVFALNTCSTFWFDDRNGLFLTTKYSIGKWFTWKW